MKRRLLIVILLLVSGKSGVLGIAGFPELRFKHYTVEDGLSLNTVSYITQDSRGVMWIGTDNGLNRYDGRNFKVYKPASAASAAPGSNNINCIVEGNDGRLWLGTNFGVYIFDPATEKFETFMRESQDGTQISMLVFSIVRDQSNNIWIATFGQGLFRYDIGRGSLERFTKAGNFTGTESICSDRIRNIYEDSRGTIWVMSYDNGISAYDPVNGIFKYYPAAGANENSRYDIIFEDSQGRLWLGNYTTGLSKLDPKTGGMTHYLNPKDGAGVLHVRCITEYSPGVILIASDDGLTFFNTSTLKHQTFKTNKYNRAGLNDNYLHNLFIDKEGGLWVGSYFGGINYSSPAYANFEHYSYTSGDAPLPGRIVSVLCGDDRHGNVWIGTDDAGVIRYDMENHTYRHYMPEPDRNSLAYHNIHALLLDGNYLWIGTYSKGLDRLDLRTGHFRNYINNGSAGSISHSSVYSLCETPDGEILVGTPAGINVYDKKTDSFTFIADTKGCDVRCMLMDDKGNLWAGSVNRGLLKYSSGTKVWMGYAHESGVDGTLPSNIVNTLAVDSLGNLWVGTDGGGICRYNYTSDNFESYSDKGFSPDLTAYKVIPEGEYLWISTNRGLARYHTKSYTLKLYNTSDGIQGMQFSQDCGFKSSDGTLYFGGINGFNRFSPGKVKENTLVPNVIISGFQLFNKDVGVGDDDSPLKKNISYSNRITLGYSESVMSFEFSSLSYMAPEKNRYSYILEGFEDGWTTINGEPKITYTNLPPGDYTLRVKASNNDGLWNEKGASLRVKVLPPWWNNWIAYCVYALILIAIAVVLISNFRRRVMRIQRERIRSINARKEKELYDSKISFFTNMIHEIRTPLTLITEPLDHIMGTNKRVGELKDDLMVIKRNSNRLLDLVNQLMDFRKTESGTMAIKPAYVDMRALLTQAGERFGLAAKHKGADFRVELPDEECTVLTDGEALNKILANLLSNALKYTADAIVLSLRRDTDNYLVISVADNGTGIPAAERSNIFKAFYQIRQNQPSDMIGTGIGLSLASSLAGLLGGKLDVGDVPEGGSVFTLTLPVRHFAEEDMAAEPDREESGEEIARDEPEQETISDPDMESSNRPLILAVDDNEEIRHYLFRRLKPYYRIICVPGAAEAFDILAEHEPDLIISDVMMPGMDGFEFCKRIKDDLNTSHIPVILLTAVAGYESRIEGLEQGADAYMEKPFTMEHLRAKINTLLANRRKVRERFASGASVSPMTIAMSKADEKFLNKVGEFLEKNMTDTEFSIGDIAEYAGLSRSVFFAKLKAVSGMTPNDYIRLIRLKRAAELFAQGEERVNEVSFMVGFSSPSYFAKCFQKQFGQLPTDYIKSLREKYDDRH